MQDPDQIIIETPEKILFTYDLADIGTRIAAYIIDLLLQSLIFIALIFLVIIPFAVAGSRITALLFAFAFLLFFFIKWFFFVTFEALMEGQTPGKKLMRIRVIKSDGEALDIESIVLRNFLRVIDGFPAVPILGGIIALMDKRRRRLGDLVADTIVVYDIQFNLKVPDFYVQFGDHQEDYEKRILKRKLSEKQLYILRRFLNSRSSLPAGKEIEIAESLALSVKKELSIDEPIENPIKFLERIYKDHGVSDKE